MKVGRFSISGPSREGVFLGYYADQGVVIVCPIPFVYFMWHRGKYSYHFGPRSSFGINYCHSRREIRAGGITAYTSISPRGLEWKLGNGLSMLLSWRLRK